MNTIKQINYHNGQTCYNILSPYRITPAYSHHLNGNEYKDYRRFLLGQTIGCYAQVWRYDADKFAATFVYNISWSSYEEAMECLDKILVERGFILCNSEEEFMKYELLI